jgi:E1A/CREB-binding protein
MDEAKSAKTEPDEIKSGPEDPASSNATATESDSNMKEAAEDDAAVQEDPASSNAAESDSNVKGGAQDDVTVQEDPASSNATDSDSNMKETAQDGAAVQTDTSEMNAAAIVDATGSKEGTEAATQDATAEHVEKVEETKSSEGTAIQATETDAQPEQAETLKPEETKTAEETKVVSDDPPTQLPAYLTHRKGKFAAMAAKKRDVDGNVKTESPVEEGKKKEKELKNLTTKDSKGRTVKVLDDDEEELDCEFLNNRQAFLNLCQGNHYQFDMLRRAKHSSMMVLWHLHNRDAPKFVQQCATCSREILAGYRFHCATCADFDQCHDCVQNPKIPRHPHPLKPMPVGSGQQQELTAAQRKERQRSIQLHMTLLLHAATCNSSKCPSANCTKMKGLLKHGAQCQIKASGGCNVCKRIWALLQIHARQCKASKCPVPNCMAIRERFRQLKKQQQAMDDRRRLEMNRAYRGKR